MQFWNVTQWVTYIEYMLMYGILPFLNQDLITPTLYWSGM